MIPSVASQRRIPAVSRGPRVAKGQEPRESREGDEVSLLADPIEHIWKDERGNETPLDDIIDREATFTMEVARVSSVPRSDGRVA